MINGGNKFLEGHTADTGNRIKCTECKCRYTHRHDTLSNVNRNTKDLKKSGNTCGEDLERSSGSGSAVSGSSSTSTAGNSYKQDWEHIAKLFIVETSVNWKHVKTKRCCQKETRNGANTRIEQHLKGIMLAQICSKNRHKRTVEEKNEKI